MPSINVPFRIDSSGRVAKTTTPEKIVEQQIIDILTTSKFERVMRPQYGAGANDLLFEPVDDLIYGEFRTDALMEISKHLTMATVTNISVAPALQPYITDELDTTLDITVQYSMGSTGVRTFSFQIADTSSLNEESLI